MQPIKNKCDSPYEKYSEYRHALIWGGAIEEEPELTALQAKTILKGNSAWMLRNIYDFDSTEESNYWYILKDSHSYGDYDRKTRYYVKKAHETFDIRPVSFQEMFDGGFRVYQSAHNHYKVNDGFTFNESDFLKALGHLPEGSEFWGAINRESGLLDAYAVCTLAEGNCWIKYVRAVRGNGQKFSPVYGLYDAILEHYINDLGLKYVTNNARSITEHSEIESYLISKFKFRKAMCKVKLYYQPWLGLLIKCLYPMRNIIPIPAIHNLLKFETLSRQNSHYG